MWMMTLSKSSWYLSHSAAGETCLTLLVADVRRINRDERWMVKVSCLQHGHLSATLARTLDAWLFGENFSVWAAGQREAGHLY